MSSSPPECVVSGALALTLRVSRLAGIAPVRMTRMPNGWRVRESLAMRVYSILLLLGLHAAILTGLVLDYGLELERSVRVRAPTASVAWITELIVLFSTTTIAVFGAPGRMTAFIDYTSVLHKLHLKLKIDQSYTNLERRRCIFIILYLIVVNLLQACDWYCYIIEAVNEDRELKVVCLYVCFYIQFFIAVVLKMQFVFIVLRVHSTLKGINDALNNLIYVIDLYRTPFSVTLQGEPLNDLLDFIHIKSKPEVQASYTTKAICDTIRYLSLSYGSICDIIDQVNKNYGKVLLPIIVSLGLHLIVTPYYLVAFIYSTRVRTINIVLEYFYFILHCSFLMLVIEPGHMTEKEIRRTATLVGQLLRRISSPHDDLATELDVFYKKILLSKVSYSPMGMCTIARPLINAMSGRVTTYLVILLQLQTLDKPNCSIMSKTPKSECVVGGLLALSLHMSRLFGVAPLTMTRVRSGWRVTYSPLINVYSLLLMLLLHCTLSAAVILDFMAEPENRFHVRTPISQFLHPLMIIVAMSAVSVAIFGAQTRMQRMMKCLAVVQKIQSLTSKKQPDNTAEKRRIAKFLVFNLLKVAHSVFVVWVDTTLNQGDWTIKILNMSYMFGYMMIIQVKLQFVCLALTIAQALVACNDLLQDLMTVLDSKASNYTMWKAGVSSSIFNIPLATKPENNQTNTTKNIKYDIVCSKEGPDTVYQFTLCFGGICDAIRDVEDFFGKTLIMIITTYTLSVVITAFYFLVYMVTSKVWNILIILEYLSVFVDAWLMTVLCEPGHITAEELDHTKALVSQLLRRVSSPTDPLALELDHCHKQLELNNVSYSPLGICTLDRSLTTVLIGTAITFIIVILQYQTLDQNA